MLVIHSEEKEYLLKTINQKREEMVKIGELFGLTSERTLESSQELDELIIKYQKMHEPVLVY